MQSYEKDDERKGDSCIFIDALKIITNTLAQFIPDVRQVSALGALNQQNTSSKLVLIVNQAIFINA